MKVGEYHIDGPSIRIARAILWALNNIRITRPSGRDYEWINISDIIDKTGVAYPSLHALLQRWKNENLAEVLPTLADFDKYSVFRIFPQLEKNLNDVVKPYQ